MYASLSTSGPVKWNHNQESTLFQHASPFEPAYDGRSTVTLSERTRELYLQFLWLPESTMPLGQFVHMIQLLARPHSTSSSSSSPDDVHPLHPALDDILLTGNWCTYKYQERLLPSIVAVASSHAHASSGADLEASIMLFVLERYALLREDQSESSERACDSLDDKKRWLSGIEKREVQIQILLHLLKLSLPGKCPCIIPARPIPMRSSHAQKRRRAAQRQSSGGDDDGGGDRVEATPRSILEDRLEGLMDRLVLWQMALPDAEASADGTKTVRDWTQAFCDDVVQPAFAQKLPEQYKLLRRKLFRIPQWTSSSEDEGDTDGREQPQTVRPESPPLPESHVNSTRNLMPSRSRSLSVSLEQEADMRRAEPRTRKVLQREVSMSKVFKGRRRNGSNAPPAKVEAEATMTTIASSSTQPQAKGPIVLVEGTPQKPKAKARSKRH
ncbi:hypothetical protein EDB89DRAFT_2072928 [Lactarius sanguifluus]|nr:hypothetical protein EDB89DRAFT_2072928 [Lactarius sanguifluus]